MINTKPISDVMSNGNIWTVSQLLTRSGGVFEVSQACDKLGIGCTTSERAHMWPFDGRCR